MKKAFSTVACMQASAEQIINACGRYGIDGVEIRLDENKCVLGISDDDGLRELCRKFRKAGLEVTDLGSGICCAGYDESALKDAEKIIHYASLLGTKGIRIFLGHFARKADPNPPVLDYDGIVLQIKALCHMAMRENVEIWVETHNEFSTGRALTRLIQEVSCENLKVIWDIMHSIEDGEEMEETWNTIGGRISHVHIKDGYDRRQEGWHDYRYTCLGEGALPLCSALELLQSAGYEGYISFEWERVWRPELEICENTLDGILSQYTSFLKLYEENAVPGPGCCWQKTDAPGRNDESAFLIFPKKTGAVIDNRMPFASGKRYVISVNVMPDSTYRISVPYREQNTKSLNAVYGVISLVDREGIRTRRFYMEKRVCGRLELVFSTENEVKILIELGIKREGMAVWYRPLLQVWNAVQQGNRHRRLKVASVYLKVKKLTYEENLKRIGEAFDSAAMKGADLVAFAETMNTRGVEELRYEDSFETIGGRFCTMMRQKAAEYGCYVFFSFREMDEYGARRNTAVLLNRKGEVVGKYHKTHLTLSEYENGMVPGECYSVFDTEFGRVGMLVCWDTFFPEPARAMALQGAEILLVTTAGNPTHRHIARAKENGVYVVVSCPDEERHAGLASTLIIDPCGNVLADTDEEGEAAVAVIDLDEKKYIYWLALGPMNAVPGNVYMHEYRDDMFENLERLACKRRSE